MSDTAKCCPQCGAPLTADAPRGLCPKCLMAGVMHGTEAGATVSTRVPKAIAPKVGELAPFFPNLEIIELIGQGGMGYVYKARQPHLDRLVALKILPTTLASDASFAERFVREGKLLAKLSHPNIVTVHDFGIAELAAPKADADTVASEAVEASSAPAPVTIRHYFLLMEYIDGVNLRQAMHAGRFTPEQALGVVPGICDALQYAHDEGVLHRDIKPENILVDSKGRVKIADFGVAKLLGGNDAADVTLTGAGSTLGTPHYMAPEQIEQPGKVDHRADIYSLGVVLYEMLTGELPIGRFAAPSEKTTVNDRIDAIVLRALEKERELRQQSATEVKTQVTDARQPAPTTRPATTGSNATAIAFGAVVYFLAFTLSWFTAAALQLASGVVLAAVMSLVFALMTGIYAAERPPDRFLLRSFSLVAVLLALPAIGFGLFFLTALASERGGWHPTMAEAVFVPLTWLGCLVLPWAAIRLHHACEAAVKPKERSEPMPETNPWPRRVFWLIVGLVVVPVVLFVVMLVVPYIAMSQPNPNTDVALRDVYTRENLVVVELAMRPENGFLELTPRYEGARLSEEVKQSTPVTSDVVMIHPTPFGETPEVQSKLAAQFTRARDVSYRVGFVLPDVHSARLAAESIRYTFDRLKAAHPQARAQLFLFQQRNSQRPESRAWFEFARPRVVRVVDDARFEAPASSGVPEAKADDDQVISLRIDSITLTNAVAPMPDGNSTGIEPPRVYKDRVVLVDLEIGCRPGVKAIALGFKGERLESDFVSGVRKPPGGMRAIPSPDQPQYVYQLSRVEIPTNLLRTTVAFALPDEASAKDAVAELKRLKAVRSPWRIDLGESAFFSLGLFDVRSKTRGDYNASVFIPLNEWGMSAMKSRSLGSPDDAPPIVVSTSPINGATNVSPGLKEIRVTFDQTMMDRSWSWSTTDDHPFPDVIGDAHYLADGRTCVLPVRLETNTTYGIWLNSEKFGNFKSRAGRSATPFHLTFTTQTTQTNASK